MDYAAFLFHVLSGGTFDYLSFLVCQYVQGDRCHLPSQSIQHPWTPPGHSIRQHNDYWILYIFNGIQRLRVLLKDISYNINKLRQKYKWGLRHAPRQTAGSPRTHKSFPAQKYSWYNSLALLVIYLNQFAWLWEVTEKVKLSLMLSLTPFPSKIKIGKTKNKCSIR